MREFNGLTRRDFLKLISSIPVSVFSRSISKLAQPLDTNTPNIIILVFDAWSQRHTSLYGYPRHTMPNLERFAEKQPSTTTIILPGLLRRLERPLF